ncbi:helix-turn-helix domain-containing protein [Methylocapsa sp. D3K7]|uniref:helix-turn-helix domain-containing protein n=1 Tax=Methylocapsa sp. D3K7 TaxID=3041435 RepID=UPI00244EE266|nr:helix-turn-helix domain-containing protein [Methylocapsa sp. D3K7]WGJ14150.1 helix-turn-helix domain-containing protein [Methylocapsa sp. D3K7]
MTSASHIAVRSPLGDAPVGKKSTALNYPRARRINDACDALQISRSHLYALAAVGKIKLIRIGSRTLVPEAELDRLVEQGT